MATVVTRDADGSMVEKTSDSLVDKEVGTGVATCTGVAGVAVFTGVAGVAVFTGVAGSTGVATSTVRLFGTVGGQITSFANKSRKRRIVTNITTTPRLSLSKAETPCARSFQKTASRLKKEETNSHLQ